jgi:hypothetical protein
MSELTTISVIGVFAAVSCEGALRPRRRCSTAVGAGSTGLSGRARSASYPKMAKLFDDHQIKNNDIEALKRMLRDKLGGYAVAIKNIDVSNLLYRGVPWPERPRFTHQLSYPPIDLARLGRANRPGQPMFYGSQGAMPIFYELRAKAGDRIALSEWKVSESFWLHNLGYHEAALQRLGGGSAPPRAALSHPIPNESKFNRKLRRKLSLAFTELIGSENEYRYKQTVAITELLFDKAEPLPKTPMGPKINRLGGILYPTVQMRAAADNFAIWPEFVRACLQLRSVQYVLVEQSNEENASYALQSLAMGREFAGEEIIWQELDMPEQNRRSYISFEEGHWVRRNGALEICDIH